MDNLPFISIIIPCRNEERFIGKCLESIITNDYPKDNLEVLIVDGGSKDNSKEVVLPYKKSGISIKILENLRQITSTGMNLGIKNAQGELIIILSAHSFVADDFIKKNVEYLNKIDADCVGGVIETINDSLIGNAISLAMSSPFGVGNARFRTGNYEGFVDTVAFGSYRKEVFDKIGFFDEELVRNQDDEFNLRLIRSGGKIFLTPKIKSYYYSRSCLKKLWQQYYQYGYWKVRVAQKVGAILTWRQLIPGIFVAMAGLTAILSFLIKPFVWCFLVVVGSYLVANLLFSAFIAIKKGWRYLGVLPLIFSVLHFSYGLGYIVGLWDFIILKKHLKEQIKDMELTR